MPRQRPGPRYTPQEAEARIHDVARHVALEAVDLVIALDKYPLTSRAIEHRLWSLTGQVGFLARLCHIIWKFEGLKKAAARGLDRA